MGVSLFFRERDLQKKFRPPTYSEGLNPVIANSAFSPHSSFNTLAGLVWEAE